MIWLILLNSAIKRNRPMLFAWAAWTLHFVQSRVLIFLLLLFSYNNLAPRRIGNCHLGSGGGGRGGRSRSWHIWMNACKQHRDPTKLERDREGERKSTLVQHGSSTSLRQVQRTAIDALFFFFSCLVVQSWRQIAKWEIFGFWVAFLVIQITPRGLISTPWVVF